MCACCAVQVTWPKLTTPEQSHTLYEAMKQQLKSVVRTVQEGCAVLPLMEAQVVHAASDNPGAVVLPHLILPLLRERLEAKADAAQKVCSSCQPQTSYLLHSGGYRPLLDLSLHVNLHLNL